MKYQNETLNERESTHGDYAITAGCSQALKEAIASWDSADLNVVQMESIDLICTKLARIVSGDPNNPDHWKDIAGYANLVSERLDATETSQSD